jgi:site-specific recombinase XerD
MEDFQTLNYASLYDEFKREKQYLHNVSPATVSGYGWAWKAFQPTLASPAGPLSKAEIVSRIAQLRADGLTPVTINTYLRSLNTFFRWLHEEGHWKSTLKISRLKEERKIIEAFNDEQIDALVLHKPKTRAEARVHLISCLILDSGARIDEVLSLERQDVDLDNLRIPGDGD